MFCVPCKCEDNFQKPCRCLHHVIPTETNYENHTYMREHISRNDKKRRIVCNINTCAARRRLCRCESILNTVDTEKADTSNSQTIPIRLPKERNEKDAEIENPSPIEEKRDSADQTNLNLYLSKTSSNEKEIDTYEEQENEENLIKESYLQRRLNDNRNGEQRNSMQKRASVHDTLNGVEEAQIVAQQRNDLKETDYTEEIPVKDEKAFERIHKDLMNERKRTKELEEKLQSLTCSLNCLKADNEQKAACLRDALENAEEQAKLAATSKTLALDLVNQTKDQADIIKADRDKLADDVANLQKRISEVMRENAALAQERDDLNSKLETLSQHEAKKCAEVEEEVDKIKRAIKEKEDAISDERKEFTAIISELTNVIKIQKRRTCELTCICNNQQHILQEKDQELSQKNTELQEAQNVLESNNNKTKVMEEEIEHLKYSLDEEVKACECLKEEVDRLKDDHLSELRIKEKIIEEQNRTIARQKKLLRDSQEMAQQAASEFEQLRNELYYERERGNSLQLALNEAESKPNITPASECEKCKILKNEIEYLSREKQKALTTAKLTIQKLYQSTKEHQKQLVNEKKQYSYVTLILRRKEEEIECLKKQLCQNNARLLGGMYNFI